LQLQPKNLYFSFFTPFLTHTLEHGVAALTCLIKMSSQVVKAWRSFSAPVLWQQALSADWSDWLSF
jgi:hypothetical protein